MEENKNINENKEQSFNDWGSNNENQIKK